MNNAELVWFKVKKLYRFLSHAILPYFSSVMVTV